MTLETRNVPEKQPSRNLPFAKLVSFTQEVLAEMVNNRDVKWDAKGKPRAKVRASGESADCSWIHLVVDMSAIGMPVNSPLVVTAHAGEDSLEWNLGTASIARTPKSATAKETADMLDMDTLLDAHRRFVGAESVLFPASSTPRKEKGPVLIDPKDGTCRECEGTLEVTGVDDCTMGVECTGCGEAYDLEHDAFDSATNYVLEYLSRRGF